ncbi:MAG: hypothetical protein JOZ96_13815 [Acidobacteria bacterium]|nr:hypothetical protein [Acidobacteriota bacterium]
MTDLRRTVSLHRDDVRNTRASVAGLTFEMPFNDTSDRIREGGRVSFDGRLYEVSRREDLRPPLVTERTIEFTLKELAQDA